MRDNLTNVIRVNETVAVLKAHGESRETFGFTTFPFFSKKKATVKTVKTVKTGKNKHKKKRTMKLNKDWLAGFIDGDGSFAIDKVGNFYRPSLSIAQDDPELLHKIKDYFGCGTVTPKNSKSYHYRCRSASQFRDHILPKLGEFPFQTRKQLEYDIIRNVALPICLGGGSKVVLENCQKQIKALRNLTYVNPNTPINLDWFLGFFEAEGNFYFSVRETNPIDVRIAFKVTQANKELLQKIQNFFGFGLIQSESSRSSLEIWKFNVEGAKNIALYGIPLFQKNCLHGKKDIERINFLKAAGILSTKGHQNPQQLEVLKELSTNLKDFC